MKNQVIIIGEDIHTLQYSEHDELFDKIAGLPKNLRQLLNVSKSLGAQTSDPMAGGYESSVTIPSGDTAFDTAAEVYAAVQVAAGVTARIWEMSVPNRHLYSWGSGLYGTINNQGYGWIAILDKTTAFQVGTVLLSVERYDRFRKEPVLAFHDSQAHLADVTTLASATPTNNQAGMIAMPRTRIIAAPYSRLTIDYKVITNVGAGLDEAGFRFPVTVKSG